MPLDYLDMNRSCPPPTIKMPDIHLIIALLPIIWEKNIIQPMTFDYLDMNPSCPSYVVKVPEIRPIIAPIQ